MKISVPSGFFQRLSVRLALVIFAVAVMLYAKTVGYSYAWDDAIVITENARTQQGFAGLASHWTKHKSALLQDQYGYRPVVMTTFGLEYGLFGANPAVPHFTNAILYGLLCVCIFAVLRRLLPRAGIWVIFAASMIYVLHPLHVEAVANIKSRDEIMAFLLGMLSLWLLLRFYDFGKWGHILGAGIAFIFAFLSKESAVAILPIMGLAILIQPGPFKKKLALLLPIPLIAAVAFFLYKWVDTSTVDVVMTSDTGIFQESLGLSNPMLGAPNMDMQLPTQAALPLRYLKEFFWPWPLVYFSGYDHIALSDWTRPIVGFSLSAVGWWLVAGLGFLKRDKAPLLAWSFFVAYLLIYAHFAFPLADLMADRFMLAASLGICLLVAWFFARLLGVYSPKLPDDTKVSALPIKIRNRVIIYLVIMSAFGGLMAYRTITRIPAWRDNLSLFSTDIPNLQDCARCHVHYAGALAQQYQRKGGSTQEIEKIISEYQKGISISPLVYYGRIELAQFLYTLKRFADGVSVMEASVKQFPQEARPYYHLGYGQYYLGKYGDAIQSLRRSATLAPGREDAPFYLAWSLYFDGKVPEAIAYTEGCSLLYPQNAQFPEALSDFHFGNQNPEQGFAVLKAAISKFHTQPLYAKIVLRYTESGQADLANQYRKEASQHGFRL